MQHKTHSEETWAKREDRQSLVYRLSRYLARK